MKWVGAEGLRLRNFGGDGSCAAKGLTPPQIAVTTQDYYDDGSRKSPRYYQLIAINRTVEAIALFGGKPAYLAALRDLETALY